MKGRIRKLLSYGLIVGMMAGSLAACGNDKTTNGSGSEPTSKSDSGEQTDDSKSSKGDKITLNFAASQNWIKDIDRELAKEFEDKTGIAIDFQLSPDDQYQTIIKSKLNTGEGPDIFMSYSGTKLKDFNPEKTMVDLAGEPWVDTLEDWAITAGTYNDTLYALNLAGVDATNGVLYNVKTFEDLGIKIPTNYEEFKTACDTLQENGITPIYEFVKDLWHTHYWMEGVSALAVANDPDLYKKLNTNEIGFAEVPEFVEALTQLQEMEAAGYFGENHMSNIYDNSYEGIKSGKYGMIITAGSYPMEMLNNIDGVNPDDYSEFPDPLVDNQYVTLTAGGTVRCISAASKNIDAAKQYFSFLAEKENAEKLYAARTDYVAASVKGVEGTPTRAFTDLTKIAGDKQLQGAEASVYFYDGGKISELCQEMFVGSLSPKEVLTEFDTARRALAKDAGLEGF